MATIIIPTPLRKFTDKNSRLNINGSTVSEVISQLLLDFPDLKKHLLDDNGKIRSFVNIFVGDDNIRSLQEEHTPLTEGSIISIIPAIAGGSR